MQKYKRAALIFFGLFILACVYAPCAHCVFDENLDPQQAETDVSEYRQQAKQKYEEQKQALPQKQEKQKILRPITKVSAEAYSNSKKDIFIGIASLIAAAILYLFLIRLKQSKK